MKRLFLRSFILVAVCMMIAGALMMGCDTGDSTTSNNSTPYDEFNGVGTLQGAIMDATTGARIGGTDLKVRLIQGTNHRSPSRLITNTNDSLVGEYAFSSIPIALYNNNVRYKIVVTKTGYQRFESEFTFEAMNSSGDNVDKNFNFIGNIYLFPTGATAGDIVIYVERGGERVPSASVMLEQQIASNSVSNNTTNTLAATTGLIPVLTATTDASGVATFSGTNLVLGGNYEPKVLPMTYEGTRLALTTGSTITVGSSASPLSQVINMADEDPGTQGNALYAMYTSNRDGQDVSATTPPGILTIVFNRAVDLVQESAFTTSILCGGGACPNAGMAVDSVTATLSTDKLTLTLTPNYSTLPNNTDISGVLTYAGGQVTISGDDTAQAVNVFSIEYIDGVAISNTVNVTGPQQ